MKVAQNGIILPNLVTLFEPHDFIFHNFFSFVYFSMSLLFPIVYLSLFFQKSQNWL